ncbi:wall-associated receptor kinase 2-like [Syzygium oleosum]|uniref:wall-associated receptor kinase 2-like n=1 Tax=Syzygium oleosum TaxID=219896 RepID=UPI0011D20A91|nr:wall-associated receptor kinase 2-like [Syzygium oleosum]
MKEVHRLLLVAVAWWLRQGGAPTVAGDCAHACGGVTVPYPFGLEPQCASSMEFLLNCTTTNGSHAQLLLENIPIRKISVGDSTMVVSLPELYDCYKMNAQPANTSDNLVIDLSSYPQYRLSDTRNNLTVLGCDTYALMSDKDRMFRSGCISYCSDQVDFVKETTCSGHGCCQASIPKGLKTLRISLSSIDGHVSVSQFNPCGLAFVVDKMSFNISNRTLPSIKDLGKRADLVLDWMVGWDVTCEQAKLNQSSYTCSNNTYCHDFANGSGYRCFCKAGYEGNPYDRIHGCQDINECKDLHKYPCRGKCQNQPGNYTCDGDDRQNDRPAIAVAVILAPVFCITIVALVSVTWKWRIKRINFRQNGGELLKCHRVRIFTKAKLAKATNNYDDSNKLGEGGFGSVYRGRIAGDTEVVVKKPKDGYKSLIKRGFQHELKTVMQVNHKNVVELHGICLETRIPLLVYEYISNGTLFQHIHLNASTILRLWKNRLRIAAEAALALKYMHSYAIIHGNIKSANILLDQNYSVKVSDFGTSVLISPEHSHIVATEIEGTLGYIDPEYLTTGKLTIKSDVYSFGVVLMELLTGKKPTSSITKSGEPINIIPCFISSVKDKTLSDVINFEAASKDEMERAGRVAEIAVKCLDQSSRKRPAMREVAQQLATINPSSTVENEETELEADVENLFSLETSITGEESQQGTSSCLSCLGMDSACSCI